MAGGRWFREQSVGTGKRILVEDPDVLGDDTPFCPPYTGRRPLDPGTLQEITTWGSAYTRHELVVHEGWLSQACRAARPPSVLPDFSYFYPIMNCYNMLDSFTISLICVADAPLMAHNLQQDAIHGSFGGGAFTPINTSADTFHTLQASSQQRQNRP
jgi:hypothetical protein